jgi:DNA-binding SARP family transcriptional activator
MNNKIIWKLLWQTVNNYAFVYQNFVRIAQKWLQGDPYERKNEVLYEIYKKNEKLRTILSTYNKGQYLIKHSTTIVVFPILNQVISLY